MNLFLLYFTMKELDWWACIDKHSRIVIKVHTHTTYFYSEVQGIDTSIEFNCT